MLHFIPQLVQQSGNNGGKRFLRHRGLPVVAGAAGNQLKILRNPDPARDGKLPDAVRLMEPHHRAVDRMLPEQGFQLF